MTLSLLTVYCVLIITASVLGGHLSSVIRMTHLRIQLLMSFVGGLMLGIALLHLLPHAVELLQSPTHTGSALLIGIVSMFLVLRIFHPHHHHGPSDSEDHAACSHEQHIHLEATEPGNTLAKAETASTPNSSKAKGLGWTGMLFGLGLHTLVDGVALAASIIADAHHDTWLGLVGMGTFLAIVLHKPLDAFAITSIMKAGGWSLGHRNLANVLFSLACPIGAIAFYFGVSQLGANSVALGWGLAISAGFFICIALSDLLPEVAFHDHDRGKLTCALIIGICFAFAVENLPGHSHQSHERLHSHDEFHSHTSFAPESHAYQTDDQEV